jgi:hypothetical protein
MRLNYIHWTNDNENVMQVSACVTSIIIIRARMRPSHLCGDRFILEENKTTILSYVRYLQAQGVSTPWQVRYIFTLTKLSTRLLNNKRFDDRIKNDLVNMISIIKNHHHFVFYILLVFYLVVIFFFLKYCLSVMLLIQLLRLLCVQIIHLQSGNHIR